jgi:hypothetical protein
MAKNRLAIVASPEAASVGASVVLLGEYAPDNGLSIPLFNR